MYIIDKRNLRLICIYVKTIKNVKSIWFVIKKSKPTNTKASLKRHFVHKSFRCLKIELFSNFPIFTHCRENTDVALWLCVQTQKLALTLF